ncbi:MAG: phage holin family protein [Clostridia bacterium]|nr:phage holin family protein [Clostridia bacterium]
MVFAVVGICLCVGYIIKNLIAKDTFDRFIPAVVGVLGAGLNIWINMEVSAEVILAGLVSGLASTGLYEAFHQFIKK